MSHFLGTPARSHIWGLSESRGCNEIAEAKNLRKRLLSGPIVDIFVGPEKRHWSLHMNLLCHHSSYFETEFQGHEVPKKRDSAQHNKLELPNDDPRGFELLVKWLYQGHLDDVSHMTDENKYEYAVACYKLYQLCDKFDMILLKNMAMDAYRSNLHAAQLVPDADEITDIWRTSSTKSPFRSLMAKIAARQIMDPGVDKDAETYRKCFEGDPNFAIEMVNAIRKSSGGILFEDPTKGENCAEWHDHQDGSSCGAKGIEGKQLQQVQRRMRKLARFENEKLADISANLRHEGRKPQPSPNSAAKRLQRSPLAELSSEKPTPRKLNATSPQSPVRAKPAAIRQTAKSTGAQSGVPSTPTKAVSEAKQPQSAIKPRKLLSTGSDAHDSPRVASQPPKLSGTPKKLANGIDNTTTKTPQRRGVTEPNKPSTTPAKVPQPPAKEDPDRTSSQDSDAHKFGHVNGIMSQVENVNGTDSDQRSQSLSGNSDEVEKKQPPKLKRKAPG